MKERLVVLPAESATWNEAVVLPGSVGVPEMVPAALMERPVGSWPAARDQA
jgi:hypothetical protein